MSPLTAEATTYLSNPLTAECSRGSNKTPVDLHALCDDTLALGYLRYNTNKPIRGETVVWYLYRACQWWPCAAQSSFVEQVGVPQVGSDPPC